MDPANDVLFVAAIQLREDGEFCSPYIIDIGLFSMIECIEARDGRLRDSGGRWIGGTPKVISKRGAEKQRADEELTERDYERDTNFGKLKRIPHPPLEDFLRKYRTL